MSAASSSASSDTSAATHAAPAAEQPPAAASLDSGQVQGDASTPARLYLRGKGAKSAKGTWMQGNQSAKNAQWLCVPFYAREHTATVRAYCVLT